MAKDIYHDTVKTALIKDGWTVTDDPLTFAVGSRSAYVHLRSQTLFAAEKDRQRIALEVKSFISLSPVQDLETALGQYLLYRGLLEESDIHGERRLYLGIRETVYLDFFEEDIARLAVRDNNLKLLVFNVEAEEVVQWIE
ncbi:MAG: fatty-acid synthase [Oscillatoria sp. SIO1A7]|nr:fatty-acid synthase [Oscillatoria sp. SIO1A7]